MHPDRFFVTMLVRAGVHHCIRPCVRAECRRRCVRVCVCVCVCGVHAPDSTVQRANACVFTVVYVLFKDVV